MREYGRPYYAINKSMPGHTQAAPYGAVLHYLKGLQQVGRADAAAVSDAMRALPVNDFMTTNGWCGSMAASRKTCTYSA